MYCVFIVIALLSLIVNSTSYVLVQVRKGENESNIDALIHKVIPSDQLSEFTDSLNRKRFNFKRFEIRQRSDDGVGESNDHDIVSQAVEESSTDGIDKIEKMILKLAEGGKGGPMMRARQEYDIQPQVVQLRGQEYKPSLMINVNSGTIISAVRDLLSSKTVAKYTDEVAEKAAVVYRAIQNEMGQQKHRERAKKFYNNEDD